MNVSNPVYRQRSHYFNKVCLFIKIGGYFSFKFKYKSNHTLMSSFSPGSILTSWKKFATTTGVMFDSYTTPQIEMLLCPSCNLKYKIKWLLIILRSN